MLVHVDVYINEKLSLDSGEFEWRFTTSGGPGGQHANRTKSRAELTFSVINSQALTDSTKTRLKNKLGETIVISVDESRSQFRNKELAVERLVARINKALAKQKRRRPTKPTKGSKKRHKESKQKRSETKANRKSIKDY